MAEMHEVTIKVVSQQGHCAAGHRVGDEWRFTGATPGGICFSAFNSILPAAQVLMFGGSYPWATAEGTTTVACPDAQNPVVFELRRGAPLRTG